MAHLVRSATAAFAAAAAPVLPERVAHALGVPPGMRITEDLTLLAREGKLSRIYGRESLVEGIIANLCSSYGITVLCGAPGVGKTALIHHLAWLTAHPEIRGCESLRGVHILRLNKMAFDKPGAAAAFRDMWSGGFAKTLEALLTELKSLNQQGRDSYILVVDEFHVLLQNHPEALVRLKDQLSECNVRILGATNEHQVVQDARRDEAMARRILPVYMEALSKEETGGVLQNIIQNPEPEYARYQVRVTPDAREAILHLSPIAYKRGLFPDTALKALRLIIVQAGNKKVQEITPQHVAEALATPSGQTSESLMAELRRREEELRFEEGFRRDYFSRLAPNERRDFPEVEHAAISLQELRENQVVVLSGPSRSVLALTIERLSSKMQLAPDRTFHCSFHRVLREGTRNQKVLDLTLMQLSRISRLANEERSPPVLLHISEADELLQTLQIPDSPRGSLPTISSLDASALLEEAVRPAVARLANVASTTLAQSPLGSAEAAQQLVQKETKGRLIRSFQEILRGARFHVVMSSSYFAGNTIYPKVVMQEMSLTEMEEWLVQKYVTDGADREAQRSVIRQLIRLVLQMPLPERKGGIEDWCVKFLERAQQIHRGSVSTGILAIHSRYVSWQTLEEMWRKAERLSEGCFKADKPVYQPAPERDTIFDTFLGGDARVLSLTIEEQAHRQFLCDRAAAYMRTKRKEVIHVDLAHLEGLEDSAVQRILQSEMDAALARAGESRPIFLVQGSDLENRLFKELLSRSIREGRCEMFCFANEHMAPKGESSPLTQGLDVLTRGAQSLGLRLPTGSLQVASLEESIPTIRLTHPPIDLQELIRYLVSRELRSSGAPGDEDVEAISDDGMRVFVQIFSHLKQEGQLQLDDDTMAEWVRDCINLLRQRERLAQVTLLEVIENLHHLHLSALGWSQDEARYVASPALTPISYQIYRGVRAVVGGVLRLLLWPFKTLYSFLYSGVKGIARRGVDSLIHRWIGS